MKSYRSYTEGGAMSGWGYAMFSDDMVRIEGCYGPALYSVECDGLKNVSDLHDDIVSALEEDYEEGRLPLSMEEMIENGSTYEELANTFDPEDIVETAEAWDAPEMPTWFYERIAEPRDLAGVKTNDGAIIFDETIIEQEDLDA